MIPVSVHVGLRGAVSAALIENRSTLILVVYRNRTTISAARVLSPITSV